MSSSKTITRGRSNRCSADRSGNFRLKAYSLMFVFLLVLVSGFFLAARQHFASIDYGIRNSRLRKQLDDLESEKRRLLVAREISLSPAEVKKAARKIGLTDSDSSVLAVATPAKETKLMSAPAALVKTIVSSAPVVAPTSRSAVPKTRKPESLTKQTAAVKGKPARIQTSSLVATRRPNT